MGLLQFPGPSAPKEFMFFAIHMSESHVQSALWKVGAEGLSMGPQSTRHNWHDDETCVNAIDQSLQELGKESENVKETLFALEGSWVDKGGIIPAKKPLFERITKELSLEAVGFVVTAEALLQHLTHVVNPQASLFFIEVGVEHLAVTLVKQGETVQTERVGRSGDPVSDFTEAFAHFTEKSFPPKFLLFSTVLPNDELQEIRQHLFAHDWPKHYPFMHPPVIDTYPTDNLMDVVVQMGGRAVAAGKGIHLPSEKPVNAHAAPEIPEIIPAVEPKTEVKEETPDVVDKADLATVKADNFATVPLTAQPEMPEVKKDADHDFQPVEIPKQSPKFETAEPVVQDKKPKTQFALPFTFHLPKDAHWKAHLPFIAGGVLGGVLILVLTGFVMAQTAMSAVVNVTLNTKTISKDATLTLDPKLSNSDVDNLLLKADVLTKEVSGEKTAQATGTKLIGDAAKGKVTLYNRTTSPKTFAGGTKLTANGKTYTLDGQVTVASASTGTNFETKPGTTETTITASAIGKESNLTTGTDLVIESFSKDTYVARTVTEVTGGSSREVLVVSKEDRDKLLADLRKELVEKAKAEFQAQSSGSQRIVPTNTNKVLDSKYSAEVGKETNTVKLTLKVQAEALAYDIADLHPLAVKVLQSEVPAGYELLNKDPEILSNPQAPASASARIKIDTNVTSKAKPVIDVNTWKKDLAGQPEMTALENLRKKAEVKEVQILRLPGLLKLFSGNLPRNPAKIEIILKES